MITHYSSLFTFHFSLLRSGWRRLRRADLGHSLKTTAGFEIYCANAKERFLFAAGPHPLWLGAWVWNRCGLGRRCCRWRNGDSSVNERGAAISIEPLQQDRAGAVFADASLHSALG